MSLYTDFYLFIFYLSIYPFFCYNCYSLIYSFPHYSFHLLIISSYLLIFNSYPFVFLLCMYVYVYVCLCLCLCVRMYVCVCVYAFIPFFLSVICYQPPFRTGRLDKGVFTVYLRDTNTHIVYC